MLKVSSEIIVEQELIPVEARVIQARLYYPALGRPSRAALIAPPHPFLGGNFDNNIVSHLASEFAAAGWLVMTYNLPGVGLSSPREGALQRESFWNDPAIGPEGMLDAKDFTQLANWMKAEFAVATQRFVTLGYSYGAAVALLSSPNIEPSARILVSPPIPEIPPDAWNLDPVPTLVVFGEADLAADQASINSLRERSVNGLRIIEVSEGDHFYLDHLPELTALCDAFLADHSIEFQLPIPST